MEFGLENDYQNVISKLHSHKVAGDWDILLLLLMYPAFEKHRSDAADEGCTLQDHLTSFPIKGSLEEACYHQASSGTAASPGTTYDSQFKIL